MKIKKNILKQILDAMPVCPPETGGIIGGRNGVVSAWEDDQDDESVGCTYRPNVVYLNQVIKAWQGNGIVFMGIVHVHFGNSKTLSQGDILYINQIMQAMPKSHKSYIFQ